MKWMLVLAALLSTGFCQTTDCPQPVTCAVNPCQDAICRRFLNAICRPDNCGGVCRAAFFLPNQDEEITNCPTETCTDRVCPERRTCVEDVLPPNCPEDNPVCRQHIRAVCELPPRPAPPSDCSVVQCSGGMVCQIFETRRGPHARCVPFRPSTCEELGPCDRGMECRFRPRDNNHPIVRCVPVRTRPRRPRDCSEVDCMDGFTCALFGSEGRQRARCVRERRPQPETCEDLNCEDVGMICMDGREPKCRLPINCDEVACPDSRICSVIDIPDIPSSFRCPFDQENCKLDIVNKLDGGRILGCLDPTLNFQSCDNVECPESRVCASKYIPDNSSVISVCVAKDLISSNPQISTCNSVPDDFCAANEACVDFQQADYRGRAHCAQTNCDTIDCIDEEDTCVMSGPQLFEESGVNHSCAPVDRVRLELNTTCADGRTTPCQANTACTDARMNGGRVGTICIPPFVLPPRSCDDVSCSDVETCVLDALDGQILLASCASRSFINQFLNAFEPILPL